jgi:hypothetical protein
LSDPEIENYVSKVNAFIKTIDEQNNKDIATYCVASYSWGYPRYYGGLSRYNNEAPNSHLLSAQKESFCCFFEFLDNQGISPGPLLIAQSENKLLDKEQNSDSGIVNIANM